MPYKKVEEQYIQDLIEISGGLPRKSISDKIAFYAVFIMNGILYDEPQAREGAEILGEDRRKSLLESL